MAGPRGSGDGAAPSSARSPAESQGAVLGQSCSTPFVMAWQRGSSALSGDDTQLGGTVDLPEGSAEAYGQAGSMDQGQQCEGQQGQVLGPAVCPQQPPAILAGAEGLETWERPWGAGDSSWTSAQRC